MAQPLRIAIVGAPGTGKSALAAKLQSAALPFGIDVTDDTPWSQRLCNRALVYGNPAQAGAAPPTATQDDALLHRQSFDLTLLTGLDVPHAANMDVTQVAKRQAIDQALRASMDRHALAYTLVYGLGAARLDNSVLAIRFHLRNTQGLPQPSSVWRWNCEKCSDPECEHQLFSSLLSQR